MRGATAECRSPRELLAQQRGQDRLYAETLAKVAGRIDRDDQIALLKNDCDAFGNIYGAQENYEATIATGWRLIVWRTSLALLLPLLALSWVGLAFSILIVFICLLLVWLVSIFLLPFGLLSPRLRKFLLGRVSAQPSDEDSLPPVVMVVANLCERVVLFPLGVCVFLLSWGIAFVETRRRIMGFLVTRPALTGVGHLTSDGRFLLSDKAHAINMTVGLTGLFGDQPLFNMGHFFKGLAYRFLGTPGDLRRLFSARQRMQISLGDSNRCDVAEYLRFATTSLVLDAAEAGYLDTIPRVRKPLHALETVLADATLQIKIPLSDGTSQTALAIQRMTLDRCRDMVNASPVPCPEANQILRLWSRAIATLERGHDSAVGLLDWPTKLFLLKRSGLAWDSAEAKKIDLKYHELSDAGYFSQLDQAGLVESLLTKDEIENAMRSPPTNSPATFRGRLVREFGGVQKALRVSWTGYRIGHSWRSRWISLRETPSPEDDHE